MQMGSGSVEACGIGAEFAEQALGRDQGTWLARFSGRCEGALGMLEDTDGIVGSAMILAPERLPLRPPRHRTAVCEPGVVRLEPAPGHVEITRHYRHLSTDTLQGDRRTIQPAPEPDLGPIR
jgi:hypothetical protein